MLIWPDIANTDLAIEPEASVKWLKLVKSASFDVFLHTLKLPLASCAALSRTSQDYLSSMFLEGLNEIPTNQTWDEDVLFSSPLSP